MGLRARRFAFRRAGAAIKPAAVDLRANACAARCGRSVPQPCDLGKQGAVFLRALRTQTARASRSLPPTRSAGTGRRRNHRVAATAVKTLLGPAMSCATAQTPLRFDLGDGGTIVATIGTQYAS